MVFGKPKKRMSFDQVSNDFWSNKQRFASFMNTNLFNGKEIIQTKDLVCVDRRYDQYVRDVIMKYKKGKEEMYLAIENQLNEDLIMPYRTTMYDMKVYESQIRSYRRCHKKKQGLKTSEEKISMIKEEEKLIPCITYVIYYGQEEWRYHFAMEDLYKRTWIQGLRNTMNLVQICKEEPGRYKNKDIQACIDISRLIFKKGLRTIQERYKDKVDKEVVRMVCALTRYKSLERVIEKEEKEVIDMCKAVEELDREMKERGRILGIKEGIEKGIEKGIEEGKKTTTFQFVNEMLRKGCSEEFILSFSGITRKILEEAKAQMMH